MLGRRRAAGAARELQLAVDVGDGQGPPSSIVIGAETAGLARHAPVVAAREPGMDRARPQVRTAGLDAHLGRHGSAGNDQGGSANDGRTGGRLGELLGQAAGDVAAEVERLHRAQVTRDPEEHLATCRPEGDGDRQDLRRPGLGRGDRRAELVASHCSDPTMQLPTRTATPVRRTSDTASVRVTRDPPAG